ncbi:MAG: hypothetical protein U0451_04100 [Candidatus Saccharimonadales bacterium]
MTKKGNNKEERKPDLSIPDQDVLEKKIKEMLDLGEDDGVSKEPAEKSKKVKIDINHTDADGEEKVASAPELPSGVVSTKDTKIAVNFLDNEEGSEQEENIVNLDENQETEESEAAYLSEIEESVEVESSETEQEKSKEEDLSVEESTQDEEEIKPAKEMVDESKPSPEQSKKADITSSKKNPTRVDSVIQDAKTDKAVEDIVAKEADDILEYEDHKAKKQTVIKPKKTKRGLKGFIKAWWNNPKTRWTTIIVLAVAIVAFLAVPVSRDYVLNAIGIKASANVMVIDSSTGQPLKNVNVAIGSAEAKTNSSGQAEVKGVKLGSQKMIVSKRAFAESATDVKISVGKNSIDKITLQPTGEQYSFVVVDYLSKKPIPQAEVVSGESSAVSDENGKIRLTIDSTQNLDELDLVFTKTTYRDEVVKVDADEKAEQIIEMVPSKKHIFVSKQSGTYSVYSVCVDGKDQKELLKGTGNERDDMELRVSPKSNIAAFVSTRSGETNQDKFKLSTLTIVNASTGDITEVTKSERVQLVGWIDDRLVYIAETAGSSAEKPDRHKLFIYDYASKDNKEIDKSNYFNDATIAGDKIYYAPSGALDPTQAKLFRVNSSGQERAEIAQIEVYKMFRVDFDNFILSANQNWLNLRIGEDKVTSASDQQLNPKSRIYVDSNDKKNSLWVDNRDGKGTLINYELSSRNELEMRSMAGLSYPVYWLNDKTVVFRVASNEETADYAISIDGGEAKKISDVTNANSLDSWYYH